HCFQFLLQASIRFVVIDKYFLVNHGIKLWLKNQYQCLCYGAGNHQLAGQMRYSLQGKVILLSAALLTINKYPTFERLLRYPYFILISLFMANQNDLDFTYTTIDKIFRLSMGETGDFSGAKYDGDFSMSLEEAQKQKHAFIADSLHIKEGSKVLD